MHKPSVRAPGSPGSSPGPGVIPRIIFALSLALALAGCQGLVSPQGQITGFTVPPGCKAQWMLSVNPLTNFSASGSCDETGQPAPASGAHISLGKS